MVFNVYQLLYFAKVNFNLFHSTSKHKLPQGNAVLRFTFTDITELKINCYIGFLLLIIISPKKIMGDSKCCDVNLWVNVVLKSSRKFYHNIYAVLFQKAPKIKLQNAIYILKRYIFLPLFIDILTNLRNRYFTKTPFENCFSVTIWRWPDRNFLHAEVSFYA